jgi:hypothetical protein
MATRLVVEWTRGALRAAVAKGRGANWGLEKVTSYPATTPAEVTGLLRQQLETEELPHTRQVITVLPREHVITRMVRFPTIDKIELRQMVELYAKSQLPYARDETVMNYDLLDQQDGFSVVNVVACQREVIERHMQVLREAGLPPERITISSWGVLGWYRRLRQTQQVADPVLIIHIDQSRVDFVIVAEGHLLSSRSLGQGVSDWEADNPPTELLAVEAERSLAALNKEFVGVAAQSILVTGVGELEAWSTQLQARLNLPIVVADTGLPFADQKSFPVLPQDASPVAVAGVACSDVRVSLSLDPPELRLRVAKRQAAQDLLAVSLMGACVLLMGVGLFGIEIMRQNQQVRQIEQALAFLEPKTKQLREKKTAVEFMNQLIAERRRLALFVHAVVTALPDAFQLELFQYEHKHAELILRGRAPSTDAVLALIDQLEALDQVAGVELKFSNQRVTQEGQEHTVFELAVKQAELPEEEQPGQRASQAARAAGAAAGGGKRG